MNDRRDTALGLTAAATLIAVQVAGKAARDAAFLSTFPVKWLPIMVLLAAVLTLVLVVPASRLLINTGPRRLVPAALAVNTMFLVVDGLVLAQAPRAGAVLIYLHLAVLGAFLVSWFWTLVTEHFDPQAARRAVGRIAIGATLGGVVGGLLAERVGAVSNLTTLLWVLAGVQALGPTSCQSAKSGLATKCRCYV